MEVGLVSCTKRKRVEPSPPAELYLESPYFRKMRAYCEENHDQWYILSAKYGLLEPHGEPVEPYDVTLRDATVDEKRKWAKEVSEQLKAQEVLDEGTTLVLHAGWDYYGELLPLLEETDVEIEIPTEGLAIGETMAWYKEQLE